MTSCSTFIDWLVANGKGKNTAYSINSRINRIKEDYLVDSEYNRDGCQDLLDEFTYSADDAKNGLIPKTCIAISGDYVTGLRSLRQALVLYISYMSEKASATKASTRSTTKYMPCMFTGSFNQFIKYIGPTCRNKVQIITRSLKKKVAACECCGKKTVLHAAHLKGFERVEIIKSILDSYYLAATDMYVVNVDEFEQKFMDAHKPYEDMFYFICQDCHKAYDGDDIDVSNEVIAAINSTRKRNKDIN